MKWDADNDRRLFLTLIKTHEIKPNFDAIKQGWRKSSLSNDGEQPTKRALSERYYKLCQMTGIKSGGSTKTTKIMNVITTPRQPKAPVSKTPRSSANGSAQKRKKKIDGESDAEDHMTSSEDEMETPTKKSKPTSARKGNTLRGIKKEQTDSPSPIPLTESPIDFASPTHRAQRNTMHSRNAGHGFLPTNPPAAASPVPIADVNGYQPYGYPPNDRSSSMAYVTHRVSNMRNYPPGSEYLDDVYGNVKSYASGAEFPSQGMHDGHVYDEEDEEI